MLPPRARRSAQAKTDGSRSPRLRPSSYCLPILNSLIDLFGQLLLLLAFEMSALLGADVRVKDVVARH